MKEKYRIELPTKDTMLFILNDIFNQDVKESFSKRKLLNIASDIYADKDNVLRLLDVLPYNTYKSLEKFYNDFTKNGDVIDSEETLDFISSVSDFRDIMLYSFHSEPKTTNFKIEYCRSLINNLPILFTEENQFKAKEKFVQERIIKGLLFSYGLMQKSYFYSYFNSYNRSNMTCEEIDEFCHIRLTLNMFVKTLTINWTNLSEEEEYVTFLEYSQELGRVCESQKQLNYNYNMFDLDYIFEKSKDEIDKKTLNFFDYLKENIPSITDEALEKLLAKALMGDDNLDFLNDFFKDLEKEKIEEIMNEIINWHDNLNLYSLCGYSTNSLSEEQIN